MMTRRFTEREKNILYKNIPLQKQSNSVGWETVLFIVLYMLLFIFGFKLAIFDYNPFFNDEEETIGSFIYFMITFIPIGVLSFLLIAILFKLIKNILVYPKYGKYAVEKTFKTESIRTLQGGEYEDCIIQIFNTNKEKVEIKADLKIAIEESSKTEFLKNIERYRISVGGKIDIPFQKVLKMMNHPKFMQMGYIGIRDFSTDTKMDSSQDIHSFSDFFRSKYNLVYSLKTNELLFVNFYGDEIEHPVDIVIKDIESKIIYFSGIE